MASFVIKLLALFNSKLKLGVIGRRESFTKLESVILPNNKTFWFHCASLGEYEQGLPVFEALKEKYPNYKIVLTFFSPSGYEIRKDSKIADVVTYLPLDTKTNAKRFLDIVKPDYTVFVKYEIWPNMLNEIKKRQLNAILISAVFRPSQSFFKWYGGFMKSSLFAFDHIFTQDKNSMYLLEKIDYNNVSVSGDTRFDRVSNQLTLDNSIDFIEKFKKDSLCIVFGSTWPEDDKLFLEYINQNSKQDLKFIIAPHNIKNNYITSIESQISKKVICYSKMINQNIANYNVFILDTIGYLSRVYSYADIVYIGGAAGHTGLHNILEPAVFGTPIIIGKNYDKFPEAKALIQLGGVISVSSSSAFTAVMDSLINNPSLKDNKSKINKDFIEKSKGAVIQIMEHIRI